MHFAKETRYQEMRFTRHKEVPRTIMSGVRFLMADQRWRTVGQIAFRLNAQGRETTITACLRRLRAPERGGHDVELKRGDDGKMLYRVAPPSLFRSDDGKAPRAPRCQYCGGKGYRCGGAARRVKEEAQ